MKPSPSRWHLADKMISANNDIRKFIKKQKNADFVNIWDSMLDKNDQPDSTLFIEDRLHMNTKGYKIWQKAIQPELINYQ
jgi:lysophospholipase L1-like esterase